jgi:GMP synthase (glutamine-hydrolysing)
LKAEDMTLDILLLQAREPDDPAKLEEQESFAIRTGVARERISSHDILQGPPSLERVRRSDMVLIGGSGEYYVSKGHLPHQERLYERLQDIVEIGHPMFASCFGFQCMVDALGGEIIHDPAAMEVGTHHLTLTEEGLVDPLFSGLPARFTAQMGRKDRALVMPAGIPNLASSQRCPNQALRIPGKPIWASQFHPELTGEENKGRLMRYLDGYVDAVPEHERDSLMEGFYDSPESNGLLESFIKLVFD